MKHPLAAALCLASVLAGAALAGAGSAASAAEAKPLAVTLDKAQVIRLSSPARHVVVGQPGIADVSLESPTMMYVFGKAPGETSLIVLGDNDRVLMSRSLLVTTEGWHGVAVHVPSQDGPGSRNYSCTANRCLRVPSPEGASAASASAPPSPAASSVVESGGPIPAIGGAPSTGGR